MQKDKDYINSAEQQESSFTKWFFILKHLKLLFLSGKAGLLFTNNKNAGDRVTTSGFEKESRWLQQLLVASSTVGDVIAFARKDRLAVLEARPTEDGRELLFYYRNYFNKTFRFDI